jgi:predicted nicotinamide N-methyase
VHRRIAGWPAVLESFAVEDREQTAAARTLETWTVADLERMIDTDELLRNSSGTEPPYWALVWIGARAIAAQMLDSPPPTTTRVLDLGCGLGLSGIAAGLDGAHVLFADSVVEALEFARASASHHGLTHFETRQLDFT